MPRRALALLLLCASCGSSKTVPEGKPPAQEPPPFTIGEITVELPAVTLAPGEELFPCFLFPLEVPAVSHVVGGARLVTQAGMHHGNVTSRTATGTGTRDCVPGDGNEGIDVANGGAVLFASSTQLEGEEWYRFPDGMGYRLKDGHEVVARMHYLNAGDAPVTVAPVYTWFLIDEAEVVEEISPFIWVYGGFEIPSGSELTVTAECQFRGDHPMHIVSLLPHMHKLGTALYAETWGGPDDGFRFLDSPGYDPEDGVLLHYDPAVDLTEADGVRFSCTWNNTLGIDVIEGVGDNEMCMVFGYAWPAGAAFNALAEDGGCLTLPTPD